MVKVCIICGSSSVGLLYTRTKSGGIWQCQKCKFAWVGNKTVDQMRLEGVDERLREESISEQSLRERTFQRRLDLIRAYQKSGRLLDVGCALGFFLSLAQKQGFESYGLEANSKTALFAKNQLGLKNIQVGYLENASYPNEFFDVVTLFHVIEHLSDPVRQLKAITKWIRRGGLLVVETPNFSSWLRKLMGPKWRQFLHNHFYFFSPRNLLSLLEKQGFEILLMKSAGRDYNFEMLPLRVSWQLGDDWGKLFECVLRVFRFLSKVSFYIPWPDVMLVLARKK